MRATLTSKGGTVDGGWLTERRSLSLARSLFWSGRVRRAGLAGILSCNHHDAFPRRAFQVRGALICPA